jgi:tRNA(Ile)-lysidine synthase
MDNRFIPYHFTIEGLVLIGVSGGPDSLCLLDILHTNGYQLVVAHLNHQLRPESGMEAEFVRSIAARMELPFICGEANVGAYAQENKLSLEESARILRYRFLFDQARTHGARAVAVGHTADDQVETILMHFLRGAGLNGLKGMTSLTYLAEFDREIPLARPILHLWRSETEAYCREHNLQPVYDLSNTDETYFRNRLRGSLIPELEKYNPNIKFTLLRMAEALAGDQAILAEAVDNAWKTAALKVEADQIVFSEPAMENFLPGLRRNLFRRAMETLRPSLRNVDFKTLERASNFAERRGSDHPTNQITRQVDLVEGLCLYREGESITLCSLKADRLPSQWPQIEEACELSLNGEVQLNNNFILTASELQANLALSQVEDNPDPFTAWMDADLIGDKLTVRSRRAGDTFSPLGMGQQTVKLQEFFINEKLPQRARQRWPLVCAEGQIAWVPGFRLAHQFRVTPRTKRMVKLVLQPSRS